MNEPLHESGKSPREEICLELAKLSEQSIEKRKDIEWKVNLGFWTGIAIFTWFVVQYAQPVGTVCFWMLVGIYVLAGLLWSLLWQVPLHNAHEVDREWKHYYAGMAVGDQRAKPEVITPENKGGLRKQFTRAWGRAVGLWFLGQVLFTWLFLLLSLVVIGFSTPPSREYPASSEDSIRLSGKNVDALIEKLAK